MFDSPAYGRRLALGLGGLGFLVLIAVLTPAHFAHAHADDPYPECDICLHLDGNPLAVTAVCAASVLVGLENIAAAPAARLVPHAPVTPHGRAPPVPVPVS